MKILSFIKNMFLEPQIVSQRHGLVTKGRIYKDKPFRYQPN